MKPSEVPVAAGRSLRAFPARSWRALSPALLGRLAGYHAAYLTAAIACFFGALVIAALRKGWGGDRGRRADRGRVNMDRLV
jgi:hypothetical protein